MRYLYVFATILFCVQAKSQHLPSASYAADYNVKKEEIRPLKKGDYIPNVLFVSKENFPENVRSVHDFKGKLILLDFWSTGCPSCIAAFPKMDRLQKKYGDRLQIILMNPWETTEKISERWANRRKGATVVYPAIPRVSGDAIWKELFPATSVPHHVWLDEEGKILAVTGGYNANETTIEALLSGKEKHMLLKPANDRMDLSQKSFIETISNGLILPETGVNIYSYYEGDGAGVYGIDELDVIDSTANTIRSTFINVSPLGMAKKLFRYVGKSDNVKEFLFNDRIFLETTNQSVFKEKVPDEMIDAWASKVRFCMEGIMPLQKKDSIYPYLFDRFRSFIRDKYKMSIAIEERVKQCLVLIRKPGTNLLTSNGGKKEKIYSKTGDSTDMIYSDTPFQSIVYDMEYQINGNTDDRYTVFNEVLFKGNVDMRIPNIYGQRQRLPDLKKALNNYGLDLIEADRKVKVFVVKDL